MKRFSLLFSDGKDFVFILNKKIHKKLFGDKKNAVIYIKKFKNTYNLESLSVGLYDLEQSGFEQVKEKDIPKKVIKLLDEFI